MDNELWRDIPGFEGYYQASNLGKIKSLKRRTWVSPSKNGKSGYFRNQKERILKPSFNHHLHLSLLKNNELLQCLLHHLILISFEGPRPEGLYGCHKDDDPFNNKIENLYWGTPVENSFDKLKNGNQAFGSDTNSSKLIEKQVLEIRGLKGTMSQSEIAKIYNIKQPQVSRIVNNKHWKHIL